MEQAIRRMLDSLAGLSVGDAFGEQFFRPSVAAVSLPRRIAPPGPWRWTDDTNMALSVVEELARFGEIDPDRLAAAFARRYDPRRGYGAAMHGVLRRIGAGEGWATVTAEQFGGQGSFGNGAAMRIAPLGAFFAEDLDRAARQAQLASRVTHAHPEASAGGVAVALAAARAAGSRGGPAPDFDPFLAGIVGRLPESTVRDGVIRAKQLAGASADDAARVLGNGSRVSAQDTAPFTLWIAAHHLDDYPGAMWATARQGGDIDTTCAIVGGIVAARTGRAGIPETWIAAREPLPELD